MTIPEYDEPPLSYLSPVKPGKYPHGAGETVTGKKWCAWCGVWGDHTSGSCEDLRRVQTAWEGSDESLSEEDELALSQLRDYLKRQLVLNNDSVLLPRWIEVLDRLTGGRFK